MTGEQGDTVWLAYPQIEAIATHCRAWLAAGGDGDAGHERLVRAALEKAEFQLWVLELGSVGEP